MRKYERLIAWQRAMDLVDVVYDSSEQWPKAEIYRLTDQVRRASISIPANIAEGQGRTGANEFAHHLSIAYGSLMETETLLIIAHRRSYIDAPSLHNLLELSAEVGRTVLGMITSLRRSRTTT